MHSYDPYAVFGPFTLDILNCFWQLRLPLSKLNNKMLKYGHSYRWASTLNLMIILVWLFVCLFVWLLFFLLLSSYNTTQGIFIHCKSFVVINNGKLGLLPPTAVIAQGLIKTNVRPSYSSILLPVETSLNLGWLPFERNCSPSCTLCVCQRPMWPHPATHLHPNANSASCSLASHSPCSHSFHLYQGLCLIYLSILST